MRPKIYSKDDIYRSMRHSKSINGAARYLGCTNSHIAKFFKMYTDEATGKTLFELHQNRSGKGILKIHKEGKEPRIELILTGEIDASNWPIARIRDRMIVEGYFVEKCNICGLDERRVIDYKVPLLLHFKDGIKKHYVHDNLELLCYNCYFYRVGDVFSDPQIKNIEDGFIKDPPKTVSFELDEYHLKNLEELGIQISGLSK